MLDERRVVAENAAGRHAPIQEEALICVPFLPRLWGQGTGCGDWLWHPALLFKVLTQKRWELLAALRVAGDVKAVHSDVHALLDFDAVRVDFTLRAA